MGTQRLLDFWSRTFFVKFFMSALMNFVICCFQTDIFTDFVKFGSSKQYEPDANGREMIFLMFAITCSSSFRSWTPQFWKRWVKKLKISNLDNYVDFISFLLVNWSKIQKPAWFPIAKQMNKIIIFNFGCSTKLIIMRKSRCSGI